MAIVTLEQQYQPIVNHNDRQLSTWEQAATHFVRGALCLPLRDRLAAAPTAWNTALDLLDSDDPTLYHRGLVGLLSVLATTPNSGSAVAQLLLDELAAIGQHERKLSTNRPSKDLSGEQCAVVSSHHRN